MNEEKISLEALELAGGYGGREVISEIALGIKRGEVVSLIGPNGSGKTTLLKCLSGFLEPMGGCVLIDGEDMKSLPGSDLAKKRAVLFTDRPRPELMTCREVAAAGRYPFTGRFGKLTAEDEEKIDRALGEMDALGLADRLFSGLSDGQKQRVLLARALCQEPKILIMDEPASYLDIRYRIELASRIRALARDHDMTVILSLHEPEMVKRISDRVICLKDGKIDKIAGDAKELTPEYMEYLFDIPEGEYGRAESPEMTENGLRLGYTTGTCAALAAVGAVKRLLSGQWDDSEALVTPRGIRASVSLTERSCDEHSASCAVKKVSGDDPDVTDGMLIFAKAEKIKETGVVIEGGEGIGVVTGAGLDQPVGAPAINSVPRKMITDAVKNVCDTFGYEDGIRITVFAPEGEEIAKKTFNSELGIVGGISILGTSGIVEPMSERALIQSIRLRIRQKRKEQKELLVITPGNYGEDFIRENLPEGLLSYTVKVSNFIGEALKMAAEEGFRKILLVGHIGKMVKLAGNMMNTHSKYGDCRKEIFTSHAAMAGADKDTCRELMAALTTEESVRILKEKGQCGAVLESVLSAVAENAGKIAGNAKLGIVIFSSKEGLLVQTVNADEVMGD